MLKMKNRKMNDVNPNHFPSERIHKLVSSTLISLIFPFFTYRETSLCNEIICQN